MEYFLSAFLGLLFGSIPTAYLLLKKSKGIDITKTGSGNVGAMNSYEVTNSKLVGIIVLIIDALKGFFAVFLSYLFFPEEFSYPAVALIFAVFGHCYSPWLGFKGGRGLATAAGGSLFLFPFMPIVWIIIWLIIYLMKKDILLANIWAIIMTMIINFNSHNIAYKYSYPLAESSISTVLLVTSVLLIIFIRHIDPLKELIEKNKFFKRRN
jgi:acyl phosphate:glycerol-3-phosphate acyltransferase